MRRDDVDVDEEEEMRADTGQTLPVSDVVR